MRRISSKCLENAALFYLKRYSASASHLKRVLLRKAGRVNRERGESVDALPLIEALVRKLTAVGYLNDARLAEQKAGSMRRGGRSARMIRHRLQRAGLGEHAEQVGNSQADEVAVWVCARKKGLGPFALPALRQARRDKDLAALARAGFAFGLAKKVIDAREVPPEFA